jgi:hypothetical protein
MERPRRAHPLLLACLWFAAVFATGCFGMVIEPAEGTYDPDNIEVWGYSIASGGSVAVQAQNKNNNNWYTLRTVTAATTPTYAGGSQGYLFEALVTRSQLTSSYRFPGPYASTKTVRLRVLIDGQQQPALTRTWSNGVAWTTLNELWNEVQGDSVIEVTIPN